MRCPALFLMAFAEAYLLIGWQAAAHGLLNKTFPRGSERQAVGCRQDFRVLRLRREKGGRWYCKGCVLSEWGCCWAGAESVGKAGHAACRLAAAGDQSLEGAAT
jgi:hypothetical protein